MLTIRKPRRVAATSVAARVAEEMNCRVGEKVGYSIRFEDLTSAFTRIKFMTDGLLLREALVDPLLSRYSVIMVDEAHERSLSTDVLLGVLKKIMKKRSELRLVVSSATLQAEKFLEFFSQVDDSSAHPEAASSIGRIVSLEGRAYPVDILYLEQAYEDYVDHAVRTIFNINESEPDGDILVFLTGREEIESMLQKIADHQASSPSHGKALLALPMYAGLPMEDQLAVFEAAPDGTRKVIVATNIAEASVTIDGVVFVIDPGFVKLRAFNPTTGIDALTVTPISQAAATQRAGRAGRTKPGKCFRLYTEVAFDSLSPATTPEIQRSNLAPVVLQLKALGIDNIVRFGFLTPPPAQLLARALEVLYSLGALDDYGKLTQPLGRRMAELSLEPMLAKCLLAAPTFGCLSEMLSIVAMVSSQGSVWVSRLEGKEAEGMRRKFAVDEGDHITLLNVYHAFTTKGRQQSKWCKENQLNFKFLSQAARIRAQIKRFLERFGIETSESGAPRSSTDPAEDRSEQIRRCLTAGYFANAARMQPDGSFRTVNGAVVLHAHPSSIIFVSPPGPVRMSRYLTNGLASESKGRLGDLSRSHADCSQDIHSRRHQDPEILASRIRP